jgi:predicted ATPase/DNA-binding XRE family transcriptional regulator
VGVDSPGSAQFGELLRRHRIAAGWTQDALAGAAGLSQRGIQDIERGARRVPQAETLRRLVTALRLTDAERAAFMAAARSKREPSQRHPIPRLRSSLPAPISSFIGRVRDLAELRRLLDSTRLLTLTGSGGIGKTRLAIRVASDTAVSYSDGIRFVELASLSDAGLVPLRVATELGINERGAATTLDTLIEVLGGQRMLLVLDNCEHLVEAAAALVAALLQGCPRIRVLATSREPLGITGEQVWAVAPLSLEDDADMSPSEAVRLFVERAKAAVPDFMLDDHNRQAVVDVCARLDGIPLAIELAAARVRTLTPAQIAARLNDRFRLLVGGSRVAPLRQQTLHATLTWSYELLVGHAAIN